MFRLPMRSDQSEPSPDTTTQKPARRRPYGRLIAILICIAIGAVLIDGNLRRPLGAAGGDSLSGPPTAAKSGPRLRLGTFNIHGGRDPNDRPDLPQVVRCISGCDLVSLNEIHGHTFFSGSDQAQLIGQAMGSPWLFAPTERRWWRDDFGNALVTSLPVSHWQRFPISPDGARSNRNLLLARVECNGNPFNVLITHLGRQGDNAPELRTVLELFTSLSEPAVLLGDLNTSPDDPQIKALLENPKIVDAVGRCPQAGKGHIDYILLRGVRYINSGVIDDGTSDHPFYWADVELPSSAPSSRPSHNDGPQ
jgi:endonuclease/exonuclease/phosphatase family metal-dependent hydrolase